MTCFLQEQRRGGPMGSSKEEAGVDGRVNKRLNGSGNACFVL